MRKLEEKADRAWSAAILSKSEYCTFCGSHKYSIVLDPAHIIPRRYKNTRWDIENGIPLCRLCHNQFDGSPASKRAKIERYFPGLFDELFFKASNMNMFEERDFDQLIDYLKRFAKDNNCAIINHDR